LECARGIDGDVSFIADVAVLPRWIRVSQLLDYVAGVHPKSIARKRKVFWRKRRSSKASKSRVVERAMVAQLHLAIVMAIDAKLLVLRPSRRLASTSSIANSSTIRLLNDYFRWHSQTIARFVTTHQVEEIQDVLTDLKSSTAAASCSECSMEESSSRYAEVMVASEHVAGARSLKRCTSAKCSSRQRDVNSRCRSWPLAALGEVRTRASPICSSA